MHSEFHLWVLPCIFQSTFLSGAFYKCLQSRCEVVEWPTAQWGPAACSCYLLLPLWILPSVGAVFVHLETSVVCFLLRRAHTSYYPGEHCICCFPLWKVRGTHLLRKRSQCRPCWLWAALHEDGAQRLQCVWALACPRGAGSTVGLSQLWASSQIFT